MNRTFNCFTIPAGKPFINHLANWILEQYGADGAVLSGTLILLPSRRACRALREAFLDSAGGRPLLLPRIQPIGDMDEDAAAIHFTPDADLPPPISLLRRELLLTRLVKGFAQNYTMEQAAGLAKQLAQFIDDAAREGLTFDRLASLAPEDLAQHWQQTLDFLSLVSRHWPRILEGEGALDPVEHRNCLLRALAKAWSKNPPDYPVIAAGSTGSQPATAALLAVIAQLPQGMVIMPGLDIAMPDAEWDMVAETHPQYGMKRLLEGMGCGRGDVEMWGCGDMEKKFFTPHPHIPISPHRLACLRAIFAPAEATAQWKQAKLPLAEGLAGVRLLSADTLLDEARLIAIALREALEIPGKTAALVTPDRTLARMVAAQMQRFGIAIDDSAGCPLMDTPSGCFLRLAAELAASGAAPSPLLALLRHPLAGAGREPAECRRLSRVLEIQLLRGIRRTPGLEALAAAAEDGALRTWLQELIRHTRAFFDSFTKPEISLREIAQAHMQCTEWLASTGKEDGAARLWAGDAGNQLAAFLAELAQQTELLPQVDPAAYPGLFETLLAGQTYRPRYGLHPRLHILSPMEARLLHFDRVILGSLNEGVWPDAPAADPWMSRPMRRAFGLPPVERAIGQSAHDFYQLAAAPEVILSRARKAEGAPTVPSRWLVRLETLVKGLDVALLDAMRCDTYYESAKQMLDAPAMIPAITRPAPMPPLAARPRRLRVTAIDRWLRDPYLIYAEYILKLKKLEALDKEPDAADFGSLAHKALEQFVRAWPQALPENAYDILLDCGRAAFAGMLDRPSVACLWWPRFEAMAAWLLEMEEERRQRLAQVLGELRGEWHFEVDGRPFMLTTRIDRMEMGKDGALTLVDYKTGTVPKPVDIERGFANQLPLEALVAMYGTLTPHPIGDVAAFADPSPLWGEARRGADYGKAEQVCPHPNPPPTGEGMDRHVKSCVKHYTNTVPGMPQPQPSLYGGGSIFLEYWKLAGNADGCEIASISAEEIARSQERLEMLIRRFDNEAEPYAAQADPSLTMRFNDYEHLIRRDEWEAV